MFPGKDITVKNMITDQASVIRQDTHSCTPSWGAHNAAWLA